MKIFLSLALCLLSYGVFAQTTNLNIFSDKGERFWVILTGVKQNAQAAQSVKIPQLKGNFWKVRIVFENQNIPELTKSVGIAPDTDNEEHTYQIKQNNKGKYVMRIFSIAPISTDNAQSNPTTPPPPVRNEVNNPSDNGNNTTTGGNGFSLKVDEKGLDFKISGGNKSDGYIPNNNSTPPNNHTVYTPSSNNGNCYSPMHGTDFSRALEAVNNNSFENSKLEAAKAFTSHNCLSVAQIRQVMDSFNFEDSKYAYATHAYNHCYNPSNYYELNDAFTFSMTKDKFNKFLQGR